MRNLIVLLVIVFSPALAKADTLALIDNSRMNGIVVYLNNQFQISGKFRTPRGDEVKVFQVDRSKVLAVEINNKIDNSGPPPPGINGAEISEDQRFRFPVSAKTPVPKVRPQPIAGLLQACIGDAIKLTDYSSKCGRLTYIDPQKVGLEGEANPIYRRQILYIKVGH